MSTELDINYGPRSKEKMVRALELAGPIAANALPGPQDTLPILSPEYALVEVSLDAVGRLISVASAFSHTFLDENDRDKEFSKLEILFRLIKSPARYTAIRYAPTIISRLASNHESLNPLGWGFLVGFAILTGYEIANTIKDVGSKIILPVIRNAKTTTEYAPIVEPKPDSPIHHEPLTNIKTEEDFISPVPDEISLRIATIIETYYEIAEKIKKSRNSEEYKNRRLKNLEYEKAKTLHKLFYRK